ncbi:outer membrane beta-barrel family protein [Deminuibacter soli]|nr:outer membrane beta-barrel family protein [Deminuibacter soli]
MKPFAILLLCYCFFQSFTVAATPVILKGQVQGADGRPMSFCNISLHTAAGKTVKGSISDSTGLYTISCKDTGSFYIQADAAGYAAAKTALFTIDSATGNTLTMATLQLSAAGNNLGNVTVTARKRLFTMEPDKMVMDIENSALATGNTVFEVLKKAPAVTTDKDDNLKLKGAACAIYIDGKPTYMSGEQLVNYLKSMPADAVAKIEIITNPGSKYDAAGSGGILNIKLKKNKAFGTNGIAMLGGGYGKYPKERGSIDLNHRSKNLNVFGSAYLGYSESYNLLNYNNVIENNGNITSQYRNNYWHPYSKWTSYKLGADYNVSSKTTLGVLVKRDNSRMFARTDDVTDVYGASGKLASSIYAVRNDTSYTHNSTYNLNLKTELDTAGSELNIDLDYARYTASDMDWNNNDFYDNSSLPYRDPYLFRNNQGGVVNIWSGKADYTKIFKNKLKLEAGAKISRVKTDNDLFVDSMQVKNWIKDTSRSNHFIYDETIAAAYATATRAFGNTNIQVGLRAEETGSTGNLVTTSRVDKRHYLNLFPTLFITQTLNSNNQLNISYSRRISRPGYQSLNPFVMYVDPYTRMEGNPFLRPSYSHSFEIKHGYKNFLFTSLSYRHSKSDEVMVILQDKATGVTTNTSGNAGSSDYAGLNITASLDITKWWSMDNNLGGSYSRNRSTIPSFSYNNSSFSGTASSSNSFKLPGKFKVQLDLSYEAPNRYGLVYYKSYYQVDLGLQRQLFNDKATLKINGSALLGQTAVRMHILSDELNTTWSNKWEGRKVNVSFVYKFGNSNVKDKRNRSTASQAEQNRL